MALVPIERQVNVATVAARLRQQMGLKDAATKEASEFATAAEGLLAATALQPESPLAAENLTGTIDLARIPVLPGNEQIVSSAGIAALTTEQQAVVLRGSIVTTTDGRRWVYTGSGSKVSEASYIVLADVTPEWSAVSGKPTFGDAATRNIGTTAGTVAAGDDERIVKAAQLNSVTNYGAVVGAGNNTAVLAAAAAGKAVHVPEGVFVTTLTTSQLPKRMFGIGQVEDTTGKRAPNFIYQDAAPSSFGDHSFIGTSFDGDISKLLLAGEKWIRGAATLGQPTSGYEQNPENAMIYLKAYNDSGHNQATSGNTGRTGGSQIHLEATHMGQGDFGCITMKTSVGNSKPGATNFLANPAGVLFNGGAYALEDGVFLNISELNAYDLGHDAAAITIVSNFHRTVSTAALDQVWMFMRGQAVGPAYSDVGYSLSGYWKRGVDLTAVIMDADKAGIAMKAGQRMYLNAVASGTPAWAKTLNTDFIDYDTASARMRFIVGNAAIMTLHQTQSLNFGVDVNMGTGKFYRVNGAAVVGDRKTGWALPTGTATRATFDTATVTLPQLAERVNGLIRDLYQTIGHGLIGS